MLALICGRTSAAKSSPSSGSRGSALPPACLALTVRDDHRFSCFLSRGYTFKAGSYIYVNSPTISRSEWHPFSIIPVPGRTHKAAFYAEAVSLMFFPMSLDSMKQSTSRSSLFDALRLLHTLLPHAV